MLSGTSIRSVIDGNGLRVGIDPSRSICFVMIFPEISRRSSNTSIASSEMSIVGSSRTIPPRGMFTAGEARIPCTAAATASLLKIVVTASKAESSSSPSSPPPCMRPRMYRAWQTTGTDHFRTVVLFLPPK
jgi:hypothetical protein